jgi:hypothetical protein
MTRFGVVVGNLLILRSPKAASYYLFQLICTYMCVCVPMNGGAKLWQIQVIEELLCSA